MGTGKVREAMAGGHVYGSSDIGVISMGPPMGLRIAGSN